MTSPQLRPPLRVLDAWQTFWFREVPPDIYALLRIGLGIVGLLGLLGLTPVSAFWPADGILPASGGGFGLREQLQALGLGGVFGQALFAGLLVSFTCMALGYRTTLAVAAAWALSVVQSRWNPLPLAGSHRVLICLLFPLVWADSGRVLSMDARSGGSDSAPTMTPVWPLWLIRVQVAIIYLNSGLSKLLLEPWRDGSAVHYAVSSNLFQRFPGAIPAALEPLATVGTYLTLGWEIGFAFMLLHPWTRRLALGFGIALHLVMGTMMELGTFSLVMLAGYLAFLEPDRLPQILGAIRRRIPLMAPEPL